MVMPIQHFKTSHQNTAKIRKQTTCTSTAMPVAMVHCTLWTNSLNQFNIICREKSIGSVQLPNSPPPPFIDLLNVGDDLLNIKRDLRFISCRRWGRGSATTKSLGTKYDLTLNRAAAFTSQNHMTKYF